MLSLKRSLAMALPVIVPVESVIEGLTSDQVKQIFSGKITSWGDVK